MVLPARRCLEATLDAGMADAIAVGDLDLAPGGRTPQAHELGRREALLVDGD
jgi:hypothetical protein